VVIITAGNQFPQLGFPINRQRETFHPADRLGERSWGQNEQDGQTRVRKNRIPTEGDTIPLAS
ncbi:MAG: hypothetical protein JJ992_26285, partial [Planctomycetes bacterium]|nr:hypothetical protein [Planctomycetota bacterium]